MKRLGVLSILFVSVAVLLPTALIVPTAAAVQLPAPIQGALQYPMQTATQRVQAMVDFRALPRPPACHKQKVLVLYSSTGAWGHLGEIYALFVANLAGRWADYDAMPSLAYHPGAIEGHALTVYVGMSYGEALPDALVRDLAATKKPVLWLQYGLNDLAKLMPNFRKRYGFVPGLLDHGRFER